MFAIVGGGPSDAVAQQKDFQEPLPFSTDAGNALIVPRSPGDLATHYDLTISHPAVDMPSFAAFDRWLAQEAADRGLNCALLHDGVVEEVIRRLDENTLNIRFHLDYFALWHVPNDPYARLAQTVQDAGGAPVNPPARSRFFTDKANAHAELQQLGLGVPRTVLVRPWTPDRGLTAVQRARLRLDEPGVRLYIKPANGFSGKGIMHVEDVAPDRLTAALSAARDYDRRDTYLVQREVR
ncbi:MAG TPA: hypothetical protein VGY58_04980, partial [Gemmataceae bacterium]|nr:hypothetical protein [Gemmataceae bacterium]